MRGKPYWKSRFEYANTETELQMSSVFGAMKKKLKKNRSSLENAPILMIFVLLRY